MDAEGCSFLANLEKPGITEIVFQFFSYQGLCIITNLRESYECFANFGFKFDEYLSAGEILLVLFSLAGYPLSSPLILHSVAD